jgi:hypothetical protein
VAANFSKPATGDQFFDALKYVRDNIEMVAKMSATEAVEGIQVGVLRWNTTANRWQSWNGTTWTALPVMSTLGDSMSGDLTFSGAARRLRIASDFAVTSSTDNAACSLLVTPNGTSQSSTIAATNRANGTNAGTVQLTVSNTRADVAAYRTGSGTYLPLTFWTSGIERMRIATDGSTTFNSAVTGLSSISAPSLIGIYNGNPAQGNIDSSLEARSIATGAGAHASVAFHIPSTFATKLTLRGDGIIGFGGWSAPAWPWWLNSNTGRTSQTGPVFAYANNVYGIPTGFAFVNNDGRFSGFSYDNAGHMQFYIDSTYCSININVSDRRLKRQIDDMPSAVDSVMQLRPVTFKWDKDASTLFSPEHSNKQQVGFIAQEVKDIIPSAVRGDKDDKDDEGQNVKPMSLDPIPIVATLAKALQETLVNVESLKTRVNTLEGSIADLTARLAALEGA